MKDYDATPASNAFLVHAQDVTTFFVGDGAMKQEGQAVSFELPFLDSWDSADEGTPTTLSNKGKFIF